ncbi:MAG: hypothetical protein OK474_08460 [Thaumarchaeota archaeon]|nr:hypothetical protein [Nitrososphaerota archaeon]
MTTAPEAGSTTWVDAKLEGARAALLVGCIMVPVYLLATVLEVFGRDFLNSIYPSTSQFAFLRTIFPSPASTILLAWQDVVLLQVVPFLLFFYFAVRMGKDPLSRILPTLVAIAVVGACLSVLSSLIAAYQPNISSLLLTGSFAVSKGIQIEPLSSVLVSVLSPVGLWVVLGNSAVFAALGITGLAFGNFSGEMSYWIPKRWLASRALIQVGTSIPEDSLDLEPRD